MQGYSGNCLTHFKAEVNVSLSKQAEKQSPGENMKDGEEPFLRECRDRTRGNDFNLNGGRFRY